MRILLAEDDRFLANGLCLVLRDGGYLLDHADNGVQADIALATTPYDLLILDLGLPGMDGMDVLRRLRKRGSPMPVLILSARDQVNDRVLGLDSGANDYLTKPFEVVELEARIRALIRKSWENRRHVEAGNIEFDVQSRTVMLNDHLLDLTPREMALMEILLQHKGAVIKKERLIESLSSWEEDVSFNAIDITVHRLRKKLGENSGLNIRTLKRVGYILE